MFFNNPIERLRQEASKLTDLTDTLTKLQQQGSLSELASLLYSIYRCEHDRLFSQLPQHQWCGGNGSYLSEQQVKAYEEMCLFKKHLKIATKLIVEDVHKNFEAYKAVPEGTKLLIDQLPHCKIVLKRQDQENQGSNAINSSYTRSHTQGSNQKRVGFIDTAESIQNEQKIQQTSSFSTNDNNRKLTRNNNNNLNSVQSSILKQSNSNSRQNHTISQSSMPGDNYGKIISLPTETDLYLRNEPVKMMKQNHCPQISIDQVGAFGLPQRNFSQQINNNNQQTVGFTNYQTQSHQPQIKQSRTPIAQSSGENDRPLSRSNSKSSLKGRQKTEFYNNLVYSSFQYSKGPASFIKEQRFPNDKEQVPGPGEYMILYAQDVVGSNLIKHEDLKRSIGSASFPKAKRDLNTSTTGGCSPGVGAYEPKYHTQLKQLINN